MGRVQFRVGGRHRRRSRRRTAPRLSHRRNRPPPRRRTHPGASPLARRCLRFPAGQRRRVEQARVRGGVVGQQRGQRGRFSRPSCITPSCITPSCISLPSCISCRRRRLELVLHREPERRMRSVEVTLRCVALRCGRTRPLGEPRFVSQLYRLAKRPRERSGPPSLEFRVAFKATCALNGPVRESSTRKSLIFWPRALTHFLQSTMLSSTAPFLSSMGSSRVHSCSRNLGAADGRFVRARTIFDTENIGQEIVQPQWSSPLFLDFHRKGDGRWG